MFGGNAASENAQILSVESGVVDVRGCEVRTDDGDCRLS